MGRHIERHFIESNSSPAKRTYVRSDVNETGSATCKGTRLVIDDLGFREAVLRIGRSLPGYRSDSDVLNMLMNVHGCGRAAYALCRSCHLGRANWAGRADLRGA